MTGPGETSVWTRLEQLPDDDLAILVDATVSVLAEQPDAPASVRDLPPARLTEALRGVLSDQGISEPRATAELVATDPAPRSLVLPVLRAIGDEPELAARIEQAYEAKRSMMVVDAGLLLAGSLFLLVLKLHKVRFGDKVEIELYDVKDSALTVLRYLIGK